MPLGYDDEATGVCGYGIRESTSEMIVIQRPVLILNDEVRPACAVGEDIDPAAAIRLHLGGAKRCKFDADGITDRVDLLSQQRSEVGRFSSPRILQSPEDEFPHHVGRLGGHEMSVSALNAQTNRSFSKFATSG